MQVSVIGLDIAKSVFHVVCQSSTGKELRRRKLRRGQLVEFFAQQPECLVGMEACGGAHYWGRELERLGHRVRLLPARSVKAYVTGAKNDFNDAAGLCEAVRSERLRAVAVKTVEQQERQVLVRLRAKLIEQRTAQSNRLRGHLAEFGLVVAKGLAALRRALPELLEDADNGLTALVRELLREELSELRRLDERIAVHDRRLERFVREDEPTQRLAEVPGFGPVLASTMLAHLGDGHAFANGRGFAASIGLVPHQHSSGGKPRLLGISKRGDPHLRSLLIHGARAVLSRAHQRSDPLSRWALALSQRRPFNVAVVALANKLARIAWVMLARGERFVPTRA